RCVKASYELRGADVGTARVTVALERGDAHDGQPARGREHVRRPPVAAARELRVPAALVLLNEQQLDRHALHFEAPPVRARVVGAAEEAVDAREVAARVEEGDVHVLARCPQAAELLRPAAEEPDAQAGVLEEVDHVHHDGEVVHAVAAASSSCGRRRETIWERPSGPIRPPYRPSAASIVRFWWVITMNCASCAYRRSRPVKRPMFVSSRAASTSSSR